MHTTEKNMKLKNKSFDGLKWASQLWAYNILFIIKTAV